MRRCPHCQAELKYSVLLCPECGKEIPPERSTSSRIRTGPQSSSSTPIWLIERSEMLKTLVETHQTYTIPRYIFIRRILATLLDHGVILFLTGTMIGSAYVLTNTHPDIHALWFRIGVFATLLFVHFFYTTLFLLFSPGTPGYQVMRLAISTDFYNALGLPFTVLFKRWILAIIFGLLLGLTFIPALFRRDGLFLHDVLTGVQVLEWDEFHILIDLHLKE